MLDDDFHKRKNQRFIQWGPRSSVCAQTPARPAVLASKGFPWECLSDRMCVGPLVGPRVPDSLDPGWANCAGAERRPTHKPPRRPQRPLTRSPWVGHGARRRRGGDGTFARAKGLALGLGVTEVGEGHSTYHNGRVRSISRRFSTNLRGHSCNRNLKNCLLRKTHNAHRTTFTVHRTAPSRHCTARYVRYRRYVRYVRSGTSRLPADCRPNFLHSLLAS